MNNKPETLKLIPRNAAALRKARGASNAARLVAGNPVSTRLESGIGNCFPGLECDLRNLERRFFPFLEVDLGDTSIAVVSVDSSGAQAAAQRGELEPATLRTYQALARPGPVWKIIGLDGTFGPLGPLSLTLRDLSGVSAGEQRLPPDAWTAVRLLTEGTEVRLTLRQTGSRTEQTLVGKRARYLDDDGSLASMFVPGELTQSLCSPWTHDFRDCGCFYWASNHPDIVLPALPTPPPSDLAWNRPVPWERADRSLDAPPAPASAADPTPIELRHKDINRQWQTLNFVLEGREQTTPYSQRPFVGRVFANAQELQANLRYAAGVELAVVQEYLSAAYSLQSPAALAEPLRSSVRAAQAELMRIALGEMRHLRAANDVLASLLGRPAYTPALNVAAAIPSAVVGQTRPVQARALTPGTLDDFIAIEAPSVSVDGLYSRILATLEATGTEEQQQAIRIIIAEGADHYQTFQFIKEWLAPHDPATYLLSVTLSAPPAGNAQHATLQQRYVTLLDTLYTGYLQGVPRGGTNINAARVAMLGPAGIEGAAQAIAGQGFLVAFDSLADPRFRPLPPP